MPFPLPVTLRSCRSREQPRKPLVEQGPSCFQLCGSFVPVVYCLEQEFERPTRTNVSPSSERELERAACSVPASIIVAVRSPRLRRGCRMAGNCASPVVSAESKFLPVGNDGSRRISVNESRLTTIHRRRRCEASEYYLAAGVARSFLSLYLCFVVCRI